MGKGIRVWLGPGIGVVVLAALVLALRATGAKKPVAAGAAGAPAATVVKVAPAGVQRVTMTAGGKTLTLVRAAATAKSKAGGTPNWRIGSAAGPAAQGSNVQSLLYGVDPLTATRTVSIKPDKAGLQPPSMTLSLALKGGSATVLDIGAHAPIGGYYAQVKGAGKVYLIGSSLPGLINADPNAWLPPKTPASPAPPKP